MLETEFIINKKASFIFYSVLILLLNYDFANATLRQIRAPGEDIGCIRLASVIHNDVQDAIASASDGDEIVVCPDANIGPLPWDFSSRPDLVNFTIRGVTDGPGYTLISHNMAHDTDLIVLNANYTENFIISNFKFDTPTGQNDTSGARFIIHSKSSKATIKNNVFTNNKNLVIFSHAGKIEDCKFIGNSANRLVLLLGDSVLIQNTQFSGNAPDNGPFTAISSSAKSTSLFNVFFQDNIYDGGEEDAILDIHPELIGEAGSLIMDGCVFSGNEGKNSLHRQPMVLLASSDLEGDPGEQEILNAQITNSTFIDNKTIAVINSNNHNIGGGELDVINLSIFTSFFKGNRLEFAELSEVIKLQGENNSLILDNNTFDNNDRAVYLIDGDLTVTNTLFNNNSHGIKIESVGDKQQTIAIGEAFNFNKVVFQNNAASRASGVTIDIGQDVSGTILVTNTLFEGNSSLGFEDDNNESVLLNSESPIIIENCTFRDNFFLSDMIHARGTIKNSLIHDNTGQQTSSQMAVLRPNGSTLHVYNSTLFNNTGDSQSILQFAETSSVGTSNIYNTIMWYDSLAGVETFTNSSPQNVALSNSILKNTTGFDSQAPDFFSTVSPFNFRLESEPGINDGAAVISGTTVVDGDDVDLDNNQRTVGGTVDIGAYESQSLFTLMVSTMGEGEFTVDPNPTDGFYTDGDTVTLTATPADDWDFIDWTGDTITTQSQVFIIMDSDKTVIANFQIQKHQISVNKTGCGSVSPSPSIDVDGGGDITFFFTPDPGCFVKRVEVDGNFQGGDISQQITITNVKSPFTLEVTFSAFNEIPFTENFSDGVTEDIWVQNFAAANIGTHFEPGQGLVMSVENSTNASDGLITRFMEVKPDFIEFDINLLSGNPGDAQAGVFFNSLTSEFAPFQFNIFDNNDGTGEFCFEFTNTCITETTNVWHSIRMELDWTATTLEVDWLVDGNLEHQSSMTCTGCTDGTELSIFLNATQNTGSELAVAFFDNIVAGRELKLTVNDAANGTISVAPGWTGSTPITGGTEYLYEYRELNKFPLANITAIPDERYALESWLNDAASQDSMSSIYLTLDSDKTVSAQFVLVINVLTVIWDGVQQSPVNIDNNATINVFNELTLVPPANKVFSYWHVDSGAGNISFSEDQQQVTLGGGDKTIIAVFKGPSIEVFSKDERDDSLEIDLSKPILKVFNSGDIPLTNLKIRYYFKVTCFFEPLASGSMTNWTYTTPEDSIDGGNYFIDFTYTSTLDSGEVVEMPSGQFTLNYNPANCTDPQCNTWDNTDDYSLMGPSISDFSRTVLVLGCLSDDPNCNTPIYGQVPGFIHDKPPEEPPQFGETQVFSHTPKFPDVKQRPNMTMTQGFDLGTMLINGSFEEGLFRWQAYPPGVTSTEMPVLDTSSENFNTYDGEFAVEVPTVAVPTSIDLQGIFYEINDFEPGYAQLIQNSGAGISEKGFMLSAWVRYSEDASGSSSIHLARQIGPGTPGFWQTGSETVTVDDNNTGWQFIQMHIPIIQSINDNGNKIRFAIIRATGNASFMVDGVTLTPGNEYTATSLSYRLTNTRHSPLQTRVLVPGESPGTNPGEGKVIVANTEYDELGRESRSFLPHVENCASNNCNQFFNEQEFFNDIDKANTQYIGFDPTNNPDNLPDAELYAFTEKIYEDDQLTTIIKNGLPGKSFSLDDSSGHTTESFYSGTGDDDPDNLGPGGTPDFEDPLNKSNPEFAYQYVRDAQDRETYQWTNGFGQIVKIAQNLSGPVNPDYVVSRSTYDERGNVIGSHSPLSCFNPNPGLNCVDSIAFTYDNENQLKEENHPDAGLTRTFYDIEGRVRAVQTAEQAKENKYTITVYDVQGRVSYNGEYNDSNLIAPSVETQLKDDVNWPAIEDENFEEFSLYIYDDMPLQVPTQLDVLNKTFDGGAFQLYPSGEPQNTFLNTKSRLCAVITFQKPIQGITPAGKEEISSVAYKYDKFGRVIKQFTYNSFVSHFVFRRQKTETTYDVNGRQTGLKYFNNSADPTPVREITYSYNVLGQVNEINDLLDDGNSIAEFEYYPTNLNLRKVTLGSDGTNPIEVFLSYHIAGGVKNIDAKRTVSGAPLFKQELCYDEDTGVACNSVPDPQFNGNISRSIIEVAAVTNTKNENTYTYDNLNRLTENIFNLIGGAEQSTYDTKIAYDKDGRITGLKRGENAAATLDEMYHYVTNTHKLSYIDPGMEVDELDRTGTEESPNYLYDLNGRMTFDKSKELAIEYDFQDRPLSMTYKNDDENTSKIVFRYDHAGNRISKLMLDPNLNQGDEIYKNIIADKKDGRSRDYSSFDDAYTNITSQFILKESFEGDITIYVIEEPNQDITSDQFDINPVTLKSNENVNVFIESVEFATAQYYEIIADRQDFRFASATHYSASGNEIREDPNSDLTFINNLPQGLGRFTDNGIQYYLKDNLGSTILTAMVENTSEYDWYEYFPYGKQDKKQVSSEGNERITETFTGKELDDGIELSYFGARYYDSDIGLWISPDPARQFHGLYTYAGNGFNPINSIDPDGKKLGQDTFEDCHCMLGAPADPVTSRNAGLKITALVIAAPAAAVAGALTGPTAFATADAFAKTAGGALFAFTEQTLVTTAGLGILGARAIANNPKIIEGTGQVIEGAVSPTPPTNFLQAIGAFLLRPLFDAAAENSEP